MFRSRPVFGCGYGTFKTLTGWPWNGHNGYLQLLGETGIIGVTLFLTVMITALVRAFSHLRMVKAPINYITLNVLLLSMLYGITGNVFHTTSQIIPIFFALSVLYTDLEKYRLVKRLCKVSKKHGK